MADCEGCGQPLPTGARVCPLCGTAVKDVTPAPAAPTPTKPKKEKVVYEDGGVDFWVIIVSVITILGLVFIFIPGFWIVGLPLLIGAGIFSANKQASSRIGAIFKQIMPRIAVLAFFMSFRLINIIPFNQEISVFGFVIAIIGLVLTMPSKNAEGDRTSFWIWAMTIGGSIFTIIWTLVFYNYFGSPQIFYVNLMLIPLIIASAIWRLPMKAGVKLVLSTVCFTPIILIGINWMFSAGGALLGGFFDQVQNTIAGQDFGLSNTGLDMILNPQLAVQAGLQPPTQKETGGSLTVVQPEISFILSGKAIPETGCYESSTFQIIGEVENDGDEFISDMQLTMTPKPSVETGLGGGDDTCADILFDTQGGCEGPLGRWDINSLPKGVKVSRSCIINSVTAPDGHGRDLTEGPIGGGEAADISATHTCFMNITGTTGFHSTSRLAVEFIESNYGRSKFEEGQLTQDEGVVITSAGPVDLSIGGFEQPILFYEDVDEETENRVTMLTTISATGDVGYYSSAYLFIPMVLLDEGECNGGLTNNQWDCLTPSDLYNIGTQVYELTTSDCEDLNDNDSERHCRSYVNFKDEQEIAGFKQFNYDNSFDLISEDFAICFYTEEIDPDGLIETGKCTLTIGDVMSNQLRKTLLIRGDVLYTYNKRGEVGITIQDCDV